MPTATSPQPRRRAPFTPRVRGDLPAALQGSEAFVTVAPAVPRPATYLLSPELLAWAPEATARDLALWETLLTLAQGPDGSVQDLQLPRIAGVRQALAALSAGGRQAQPRELVDSLHRLFGRERAPLKLKSEFDYRLPSFLGDVLVPGRYGHLDLVTLARFRHRASALLYRRLVGELAASKARYVAGGAPHRIELTPIELAAAMGLSDVRVGQLKAAYLAPALGEIAEHVRAFRVVAEEAHGEKRPGQLHAPLERVVLAIELLPPERLDAVPVRRLPREDFAFLLQQRDAARYRVSGKALARVSALFAGRSLPGAKAGPGPAVASDVQTRLDLWLVAVNEALTGVPVTPRRRRGPTAGRGFSPPSRPRVPTSASSVSIARRLMHPTSSRPWTAIPECGCVWTLARPARTGARRRTGPSQTTRGAMCEPSGPRARRRPRSRGRPSR